MKEGIKLKINKNITLEKYIAEQWLPRKQYEVKVSTYTRYCGLTRRINAALGSEKLRDISVMDIYSFYDDLREAKSEQITCTSNWKSENRKVSPNSNSSRKEAGKIKNPMQCRVVVP